MTKRNSTSINPSNQVKRTVYGVGYDSGGKHKRYISSKSSVEYAIWSAMIGRCYSERIKNKLPSYKQCSTSPEWHDFQVFAEWYTNHDYYGLGYDLDKDLLFEGNKVYSPETCCLIPHEINTVLLNGSGNRSKYPVGVSLEKWTNRFKVTISINNKTKYLGRYDCPKEAGLVYVRAKKKYMIEKADEWRDRIENRVYEAILARAK